MPYHEHMNIGVLFTPYHAPVMTICSSDSSRPHGHIVDVPAQLCVTCMDCTFIWSPTLKLLINCRASQHLLHPEVQLYGPPPCFTPPFSATFLPWGFCLPTLDALPACPRLRPLGLSPTLTFSVRPTLTTPWDIPTCLQPQLAPAAATLPPALWFLQSTSSFAQVSSHPWSASSTL